MRKTIINIFLLLTGSISQIVAQEIAVLEMTNLLHHSEQNFDKYDYCIRPLFNKVSGGWEAIDKSGTSVQYNFLWPNQNEIVNGKSIKNSPLYKMTTDHEWALEAFPEHIISNFEHRDILSFAILVNQVKKPYRSEEAPAKDVLTSEQKELVLKAYSNKLQTCSSLTQHDIETDKLYTYTIQPYTEHLMGEIRLGFIETQLNNSCFTVNASPYGVGKIQFVIFPDNRVEFLHVNATPLIIHDFDNDGKNEYIYFSANYNNYYYIIYYNDFKDFTYKGYNYY